MQKKFFDIGESHKTYPSLADPRVNAIVEKRTSEPFYYCQAWLALIERLYGYPIIPLTSADPAGQITGFLPLCYIDSPLTGRRLVSLPFSDYCPLIAADAAAANDLIDQAVRLAQEKGVKYLELRAGSNEVLSQRADFAAGNLYVRWLKTLAADPDTLWSSISRSVREKVNRARRRGVQVRLAQHREEMEHYYRLHLLTRTKKHGMPAQSHRYFFELWDSFASSGAMQLWLAEYQGTILAGEITFLSGSTMRYGYNASDQRYLDLAPNHLLVWTAIKWACLHNYQVLDFGRTACDNAGLMEFKRRWGAVKEPLPYYYYPSMAGLATTSERTWKFRLLTTCWKRLPTSIAGWLGSRLYKHLG